MVRMVEERRSDIHFAEPGGDARDFRVFARREENAKNSIAEAVELFEGEDDLAVGGDIAELEESHLYDVLGADGGRLLVGWIVDGLEGDTLVDGKLIRLKDNGELVEDVGHRRRHGVGGELAEGSDVAI